MTNIDDIRSISTRDRAKVFRTPLLFARHISDNKGYEVYLKCENLQRTGSYKVRGNLNKIANLTAAQRASGVVTTSAGNHAQAVAWAAATIGVEATIVMPSTAPRSKIAATEGYGGIIEFVDDITTAFPRAIEIGEQTGKSFIHPFEDQDLIAGHGTLGLELMEDLPDVDVIVAGVGGGAMLSGVAIAAKSLNPQVRIYGVEPEGANAMSQSFETGGIVKLDRVDTIADGLGAPMSGELTYKILHEHAEEIITITDEQIASVMGPLLQRSKILVEPAGAAATAAIEHDLIPVRSGEKVVSIISGGNIDLDRFVELTGLHVTADELPNIPSG